MSKETKEEKATPEKILEIWNEMSEKNNGLFPKVRILTTNRRKSALRLVKDVPLVKDWENLISMVPRDSFRSGENHRQWIADFDWLLRTSKDNHVKLLEEFESNQDAEDVLSGGFGS